MRVYRTKLCREVCQPLGFTVKGFKLSTQWTNGKSESNGTAEIVSLKILVGGVDLFDGLSELSMAIVDGRRCDVVLAISRLLRSRICAGRLDNSRHCYAIVVALLTAG